MADNLEKQPYMEDADSDGNAIEDTKTYISTTAPLSVKEAANVSRTRKDRDKDRLRGSGSSSPTANLHHDSDSAPSPASPLKRESRRPKESRDRTKEKERKKSVSYDRADRPRPRASKTLPNIQTSSSSRRHPEQPSHSKPSPVITTAATNGRPRAYTANSRPTSYYGPSASKPPPANARFYTNPSMGNMGTSYPPQAPYMQPPSPTPFQSPFHPPQPQPFPPPAPDYFNQMPRPMPLRPDYRRPSSALGHHPYASSPLGYSPEYENDTDDGAHLLRKPSLKKRPTRQEMEDRARMPPPPRRPSTTTHARSPFVPPPDKRRSIGSIASVDYDDESVDDESFYSPSEQAHYNYRPLAAPRPSIDPALMHDSGPRHEHVAGGRQGRRNSIQLGGRSRSAEREMEDKIQSARRYQEKVDGPVDPLTFDSLQQISKTASHGTKSTRSRGESAYAPTNRTSVDISDDMRILVRGTATLTIGDAQMGLRDGAEIRIPTSVGGDRTSRGGSDPGSLTYDERDRERERERERRPEENRRTRDERERLGARERRATSRNGSHSRAHAQAGLPSPYPRPSPTEYGGGHYYQHQPMAYAPPYSHPFTYPQF